MLELASRDGLVAPSPEPFGRAQSAALDKIVAAVHSGLFVAVLGESSAGKSAVLDRAVALLGCPPIQLIRIDINGESLTDKQLIELLIDARGGHDLSTAIEQAQDRLLRPLTPYTRTVLLIDNAHKLLPSALLYLQQTIDLAEKLATRAQIVLAGPTQFWSLLDGVSLRPLRDRFACRVMLEEPANPSSTALPRSRVPSPSSSNGFVPLEVDITRFSSPPSFAVDSSPKLPANAVTRDPVAPEPPATEPEGVADAPSADAEPPSLEASAVSPRSRAPSPSSSNRLIPREVDL